MKLDLAAAHGSSCGSLKTDFPSFVAIALLAAGTAEGQIFPAADRVLGASDFTTPGAGGATASEMFGSSGLAVDPTTGKLFVLGGFHRVMRFADATALANGASAEAVFGQVDFAGTDPGTTASTLRSPTGLHVDELGRLWVADAFNHRVLMFENASTAASGVTANRVFGQADFTSDSWGSTAEKMYYPFGVLVDAADNLWVADLANNRVLRFAAVTGLPNGSAATAVLGQPDFTTWAAGTTAAKMRGPTGLTVDGAGRLWVADESNHRLLRFDNAAVLPSGAAATGVLGQPGFTTSSFGTTAQSFYFPGGPIVSATGTLYCIDILNNRVLLFKNAAAKANGAAADGVIGQTDFTTATSGTTAQKLKGPSGGLALDGSGRLWLSDNENHRALGFSVEVTAALLDATLTAVLSHDANGNIEADAGDEIACLVTLTNADDMQNEPAPGVNFVLAPPAGAALKSGTVAVSQGTVTLGNMTGDGTVEVDLGAIADGAMATIGFTLTLGFEASSPLHLQGTVSSDLPGDLPTDDPGLPGAAEATEYPVNFTYRPATFTVARVKPVKTPATTLSGTATNALSVEVKRKPSGPTRIIPVTGTSWRGRVTGLKTGSNAFAVRAHGKDGAFTAEKTVSVRRLAARTRR